MEIKKLGIFPNTGKENVMQVLDQFINLVRDKGIEPLLPIDFAKESGCQAFDLQDPASLKILDASVSLGGDGTLLSMAQHTAPLGIPGFGINLGTLGFLAEIDLHGLEQAMENLAHDNYFIEARSLLEGKVLKDGQVVDTCFALNDIVLEKGMWSKMAHLNLFINGKHSGTYSADGLIISTATGSTAYSLSAGGPLVMPELDVSIITPICAHSLTARTLVIPMSETIEVMAVPGSEDIKLSADGETVTEVDNATKVRINKSPYKMKFIRLTNIDYYQTWQQKLMRNV